MSLAQAGSVSLVIYSGEAEKETHRAGHSLRFKTLQRFTIL